MSAIDILRENIRRGRLTRGWSQERVAEKAGISPRHFQDIEGGRRPGVRLQTIESIAKVLGVEIWHLFKRDHFPEPKVQRGKS